MKILIPGGSPRKNGNPDALMAGFAAGARESGHGLMPEKLPSIPALPVMPAA